MADADAALGRVPEPVLLDEWQVETLDGRRDPVRLRAYLEALALNTAGVVTDKTLYEQLRAEVPVCASRPRMYHVRQDQGATRWASSSSWGWD
ncbi:hypothetical protein ACFFHJ_01020 [Planotetraspora thailandica]|uniref:hypothetical protein n=1 Tax=Planotetraspora thailandica TaxID=487172 RepID=UPI00194F7D86|nr:hypothetical protein [Planotetraspora thailandica]